MEKLVIFFLLASLTQNEIISNKVNTETEKVSTYEYWTTFSETFEETANYWKAESAALEAESIAEDKTNVQEWLQQNGDNLKENTTKTQC